MALADKFSEIMAQFSLDKISSGEFLEAFGSVLYMIIAIAIYAVVIWHFYRFIARRDCFKIGLGKHPKIVGFLKYFFIFPFVAFIFFIGFSLLMLFLTRGLDTEIVLSTSFAIIVAIRFTAYYSEDLSKDVAKMLPFALLGIFLVDPLYFNFDFILQEKVYALPVFLTDALQYILFIILVEWILRILLTIRYAIFPKKMKTSVEEQ